MNNENITLQNDPRLVPAERIGSRLAEQFARSFHGIWMGRLSMDARADDKDEDWLRSQYPAFKPWNELEDNQKRPLLNKAIDIVNSLAKRFDLNSLLDPYCGVSRDQMINAVRDKDYGRIAAACVEDIRERKVFEEDIIKGVLGMKPGSAEANAAERFAHFFCRMNEREQLEVCDRAIKDNKVYFDVSTLEDMREYLRDVVAKTNKSFLENRGKDGHYKDWESFDADWRQIIHNDPIYKSDFIKETGRECFLMLRDACVDILKEKGIGKELKGDGVDQKLIDSLTPEASKKHSRRMKSSEMLKAFEDAGKSQTRSIKR